MIVVTGVTGRLGQRVVDKLLETETPQTIVASMRGLEGAQGLAAKGVEIRRGDYDAPRSLKRAFAGADKILIVSGTADVADRIRQHRTAIDAARESGAGHIVLVSFADHDADSPCSYGAIFADTEAYLEDCGAAWTIVRNNYFADNFLPGLAKTLETGRLGLPAGDGCFALVTLDDAAASLCAILTGEGHLGKAYDLTGPESLGLAEAAAIMAQVHARPVAYDPFPEAEFREILAAMGVPPYQIDGSIGLYQSAAQGRFAETSGAVEALTGQPPENFTDFLLRNQG